MKTLRCAAWTAFFLIVPTACEPGGEGAGQAPPPKAGTAAEAPVPLAEAPAPPAAASDALVIGGLAFSLPEGWSRVPPANPMRLAEVHVPAASADPAALCIVTFSTAGGDVQANIDRWAAQVRTGDGQPSTPDMERRSVAGIEFTIAAMTGVYVGMGNEPAQQDWTLRGAIAQTPQGLLFIKMTGPADAMTAAADGFAALISSAQAKR